MRSIVSLLSSAVTRGHPIENADSSCASVWQQPPGCWRGEFSPEAGYFEVPSFLSSLSSLLEDGYMLAAPKRKVSLNAALTCCGLFPSLVYIFSFDSGRWNVGAPTDDVVIPHWMESVELLGVPDEEDG